MMDAPRTIWVAPWMFDTHLQNPVREPEMELDDDHRYRHDDVVRELVEALEPFAKAADIRLCGEWRDDEKISQTDVPFYISFGDLRRAHAALAKIEK